MDEQLAAIYGTGQSYVDESDLEKTAAAELLVKLAEEQGVDLNDFSDAEVAGMLDDLYGGGGQEDVGQEKFAEADYLGRVMAHSMVQELNEIEKEASIRFRAEQAGRAIKSVPGKLGRVKELLTGSQLKKLEGSGFSPTRGVSGMIGAERKAVEKARGIAKGVGKGVGAAGLLGGAGYVGGKAGAKQKTGSALDTLAEQRAYELAAEAGYIKEASAFDYEVERRALEICEANGIPVDWNA